METKTTFFRKLHLSKLPKVNIEKNFYCPICSLPVSIRKDENKLYFVCESPLCSFYRETSYDELKSMEEGIIH